MCRLQVEYAGRLMPFLFSTWTISKKSTEIDNVFRRTIIIDYGVARPVFGIIYKYRTVTLGLGMNGNRICSQSRAEDPRDEGTLLVVSSWVHAKILRCRIPCNDRR